MALCNTTGGPHHCQAMQVRSRCCKSAKTTILCQSKLLSGRDAHYPPDMVYPLKERMPSATTPRSGGQKQQNPHVHPTLLLMMMVTWTQSVTQTHLQQPWGLDVITDFCTHKDSAHHEYMPMSGWAEVYERG